MFANLYRTFLICSFCLVSVTSWSAPTSLLPIKRWITQAGTPVLFVQERELPMLDVQVVFDAGSARDDRFPGLARMTNEALSSGTKTKNANQIAAAFEEVGANYSVAVNRDMAVVALRSLSDPQFLTPSLLMFSQVIAKPNFPATEFLRIKKQTLNTLDEQEEQPSSIASKAFYNSLYDGLPYGHPIIGTKACVEKLTVDQLKTFYQQHYIAQNALITIVGSVDEAKAKQIAEDIASQLLKGKKSPVLVTNKESPAARNQHIAFPSSQTHVLIGQKGINRNDPNYFSVIVGNYILGGGTLTSRLFDAVREQRGLAYSVHSQFNAFKDKGPFIIELQTRNSQANNAIQIVTKTIKEFVEIGPSDKELMAAKDNLTKGFILRLASNSAITSQLTNIGFYQLPLDYLDTYQRHINEVTNQQVKQVFKQVVRPDQLLTVTVGNATLATNEAAKIH